MPARKSTKVAKGGTAKTGLYRGRKGKGVGYPRPKLPSRVDRDSDGVVVERKASARKTQRGAGWNLAPKTWAKKKKRR